MAPSFAALATALAGCPVTTTLPAPPPDRPKYALTITIASSKKVVKGISRVTFTLDRPTDRIVFRLWQNMPVQRQVGAQLAVRNVRVDGATVTTTSSDPTTLVLERSVAAGERVVASMSWTLHLPRTPTERLASRMGVRLSSFFPLLAWSGTDWALDPPAPQLETWTSPIADFDVKITTPKGMRVYASGGKVGKNHWRASAVRDFALEAGTFKVARSTVHVPGAVRVTVISRTGGILLTSRLNAAAAALKDFSPSATRHIRGRRTPSSSRATGRSSARNTRRSCM
jgi:hypothetical protein